MKAVWGAQWDGYLDYVTAWYKKALDYFDDVPGRWAFVSTNSICQGEATAPLWQPILDAGWRCRFAHRTFLWTSEAKGAAAAVHCSIVGFDRQASPKPLLWTYPQGGKGDPTRHEVSNISPYLTAGPDVLVHPRTKPISSALPKVVYGSKPTDDGGLIVEVSDYDGVNSDPVAAPYLRPYVGSRELLWDLPRWCLWLEGVTAQEVRASSVLSERVARVEKMRRNSSDKATQKAALTPTRFQYDRQPTEPYVAIPRHVSEARRFFTVKRLTPDIINGDANFTAIDPDGFVFGVLSSSMFITWMRAIGGRIKSDLRFSSTFTYNTFPLPNPTARQREAVIAGVDAVLTAREALTGQSLGQMYDPLVMAPALLKAHAKLDRAVDAIFATTVDLSTEEGRERVLFDRYVKATKQGTLMARR